PSAPPLRKAVTMASMRALVAVNSPKDSALPSMASLEYFASCCESTCNSAVTPRALFSCRDRYVEYAKFTAKTISEIARITDQARRPKLLILSEIELEFVLMSGPHPKELLRKPPSSGGLPEFRRARQHCHAEHTPRYVCQSIDLADEVGVTPIVFTGHVGPMGIVESTLTEQLVDDHRDIAAGLAHHQATLAFMHDSAFAFEKLLEIDHRQQAAADIGDAQHPRLRTRHRGDLRQREDFHDFVERGHQPALPEPETDAAPVSWRLDHLGTTGDVRERTILVIEQGVEGTAALAGGGLGHGRAQPPGT